MAVLVLFFLGGLVRVTGAGMGCPDWPKCFGQWVPPTSEDQLPADYQEQYTEKREKKIERLISVLNSMGMTQRAEEIQGTTWLLEPHAFNVGKAYTEYINRLWGALTGFFALLAVVFSLSFWKTNKMKVVYTIIGLVLVGYNGWLGSIVVDTNLFGGMVTIHFILAFLAVAFFMLGYSSGNTSLAGESISSRRGLIVFALTIGLLQLISGTLVREEVDILRRTSDLLPVDQILMMGNVFAIHRIIAPILAIVLLTIWYQDRKFHTRSGIRSWYLAALILVGIQIITGTLNIWYSFPVVSQLVHVVAGSLMLSGLIYLTIHEFKAPSPIHA